MTTTKKIANWLAHVIYKEKKEQIKISFHPLPFGTIFTAIHFSPIILLALFSDPILALLVTFYLFCWIVITSWTSTYQIIMDIEKICIKQRYFGIPIRSITTKIDTVIIDDQLFNDINCINQRKDWYKEELKNNLRFSFIEPWDGNKDELYITYKNKEMTFVNWGSSADTIWAYLVQGFQRIDELQVEKANDKIN